MTPAQLAEIAGVKTPSVYDWLKFGRIAKNRLPVLAKTFDRPLSWWIDAEDETELIDDHERQLLVLYRKLGQDGRDKLLQEANWLHNRENPEASIANPFAKAGRPPVDRRKKPPSES